MREALKAHGLRTTPQRQAILRAFDASTSEHLSAEEIHARASLSLTSLSRATVYATLAELTELGLLAATPLGILRLAFEEHFDAEELRKRAASRRGSRAARQHLNTAATELSAFLAGGLQEISCPIDSTALSTARDSLNATRAIPYAEHGSYTKLIGDLPPKEFGRWMGANPIPLVLPCHRVTHGKEVPRCFVGGLQRRQWLEDHERQFASLLPALRSVQGSWPRDRSPRKPGVALLRELLDVPR
jgi:O6-methylguanine-DNA--protein-cysteine methyltransferase